MNEQGVQRLELAGHAGTWLSSLEMQWNHLVSCCHAGNTPWSPDYGVPLNLLFSPLASRDESCRVREVGYSSHHCNPFALAGLRKLSIFFLLPGFQNSFAAGCL